MKKFIFKIPLLLLLLMLPAWASLQTINTTAGSLTSCPGEVVVPLEVSNFNNVGGISLVLAFNANFLTYLNYTGLHPALSGGQITVNQSGSSIYISWAKETGASIGSGVLLNLRFAANPGSAFLNWDTQTPGNCEYSHVNGTVLPATFINGTATIQQPPVINTQPVNRDILVGQNTTFSISAQGTGITYSWYLSTNGGANWSQLTNGGHYAGATAATLTVSNALLSMNNYLYKCEVSGTCSPAAWSQVASLQVIKPLITSLQTSNVCPVDILVPVKTSNFTGVAAFSLVLAYNPGVLAFNGYQELNSLINPANFVCNASEGLIFMAWASGSEVSFTADTILLKLKFLASTGAASLNWKTDVTAYCEYSRLNGTRITSVFQNGSFSVLQNPVILTQPQSRLIPELTSTSFSVSAQASGISYQWQISNDGGNTFTNVVNGGFYSGATTATLAISNANLNLNGRLYRCTVGGACGVPETSDAALLSVLPKISTTAGAVTGCPNNTLILPVNVQRFIDVASFSLVLSYNPAILNYTGYQSLNPALNAANFIVNQSNGKLFIAWYSTTPATLENGLLVELTFSGNTGNTSVSWDTQTSGNCEYINVQGQKIFTEFGNGSVTVNQPPIINTHPENKLTYGGGNTSFSVSVSATSPVYQWQVSTDGGVTFGNLSNGSPYTGVTTANLTINPAAISMDGYKYRCYVTGACSPFVYTNPATLTVTANAISTTIGSISNSCTGNVSLPVTVTNCNNIGGVSLVLLFDNTKMQYAGYHSLHSQLNQGMLVVNSYDNRVVFSWASTTPLNISSGTLVQFHFRANAGISSALTWNTQIAGNCEYSNSSGNTVTAFFNNGSLSTTASALVVNAGEDVQIQAGNQVQLNATISGGVSPITISWSPSAGLSNTNILNPDANPAETTTYRLTATGSNGCQGWDEVTVFVDNSLPENLTLQNVNVTGTHCYNASQTIILAGQGTYFTVQAGANLELLAGQNIVMLPGTHFISGSEVLAKIVSNNMFCNSRMIVEDTGETDVLLERLPAEESSGWYTAYPNPTDGLFYVKFSEGRLEKPELAIFNFIGEEVVPLCTVIASSHTVDLRGFPSGVYILKIVSQGRTDFIKVLKY
jgi:hypothetical protein